MSLLLHTCCAPCLAFPLNVLRQKGIDFTSYFFNPNIHPYKEFTRRMECYLSFVKEEHLNHITDSHYGLKEFVRIIANNEEKKCSLCYLMRLEQTVLLAKENNFSMFSTTLLYSKYQKHNLLVDVCRSLEKKHGVPFFYHDFRSGWQKGIDLSRQLNMYRQPYCGCIYSEQERYDPSLRKKSPVKNR